MPAEPDGRSESTPQPLLTAATATPAHQEAAPIAALGRWIRQVMGRSSEHSLKEALQEMLEEHDEAAESVDSEELTLLRNMVAFGSIKVSDVMIPRTDITAISDAATPEEIKQLVATEMHTRIPIYQDSLDQVTGFLHMKDLMKCLLTEDAAMDLQSLRREILFVPASMKIIDLLLKMRLSGCHIAIVVDEYGGTDGLVTMEDLFEEIVGDIHDEHDDEEEEPSIRRISENVIEADARLEIEDLMQAMDITLSGGQSADDFDTIGGLIFSHLGRIPAKGEVIDYSEDIKFEILLADPRRIRKVRVVRH